jgi:hypothetical protein
MRSKSGFATLKYLLVIKMRIGRKVRTESRGRVEPVTVAVRSEAWVLAGWLLDRGFESHSRHGCLSASFYVVLS